MWCFSGGLSPHWQLSESLVCGSRAFCRFCPEECGALVGGDRSRKDLWVYFGTSERTKCSQVFVESVLMLFKSLQRLI